MVRRSELQLTICLEKTVSHDKADAKSLMSTQLALFEECLVDDEDSKCLELDMALTLFEANLGKGSNQTKYHRR